MKFKKATIKDFRRFSNLTVQGIPDTAMLIILAGPNGCGKSSFLDALHTWHKWSSQKSQSWDEDYHVKTGSPPRSGWTDDVAVEFHDDLPNNAKKVLYVRSAYRNDPEFQIGSLQRTEDPLDSVRVNRMIDNDAAVSLNYQRLASQGVEDLYESGEGQTTFSEYRETSIGLVQEPLCRLFPDLELVSLGNPLGDGTFRFAKGASRGFMYKNLSGGEKSAFDLILDLIVAQRDYDNTVFCIDEPESHMNARLQADLLSVLYDLIPRNCQLVLATHSIGMMRRARDIEAGNPGSVVFLDFGGRDFDEPQIIEPRKPDRTFWKKAYDVSLDDLAALVAPEIVVICEGHPKTQNPVANHSQDSRCYERIFETECPGARFLSVGSHQDVTGDRWGLAEALPLLIGGLQVVRLIDRDDRSEEEVAELSGNGVQVLSRRNLESYLFDDEVLRALATSVDKEDKIGELIRKKQCIRTARTGDSPDDLKPSSGEIYISCKRILNLTRHGNTVEAFMRDTLAPLIKTGMPLYDELKRDIFGAQ